MSSLAPSHLDIHFTEHVGRGGRGTSGHKGLNQHMQKSGGWRVCVIKETNQVSGQERGLGGGKWREGEIVDGARVSSGGASNVRPPLSDPGPAM